MHILLNRYLLSTGRSILHWLLYTSVFAGCCVVSLCLATEYLLGIQVQLFTPFHLFLWSGTLVIYNLHHLFSTSLPTHSDRAHWIESHRVWPKIVTLTGIICCLACLPFLHLQVILPSILLACIALSYTLPLLPGRKQLRNHGWIKIISLTLVWTLVTSLLPILQYGFSPASYPFELIIRFLFIFTLCMAFDIRDMHIDNQQGIFTLPGKIGIAQCYRLIQLCLILLVVFSLMQYFHYGNIERLYINLFIALLSFPVIQYCIKHPSDKNFLGLTDGMMFLYGMLTVLLH